MVISEITLKNFLSYGEQQESVPLGPLNVVIGPSGSGKSTLLEAIKIIRNARAGQAFQPPLVRPGYPAPCRVSLPAAAVARHMRNSAWPWARARKLFCWLTASRL